MASQGFRVLVTGLGARGPAGEAPGAGAGGRTSGLPARAGAAEVGRGLPAAPAPAGADSGCLACRCGTPAQPGPGPRRRGSGDGAALAPGPRGDVREEADHVQAERGTLGAAFSVPLRSQGVAIGMGQKGERNAEPWSPLCAGRCTTGGLSHPEQSGVPGERCAMCSMNFTCGPGQLLRKFQRIAGELI